METRHTFELGAENPTLQMIKFSNRKIERWIDCESCEGHRNNENDIHKENKDEKRKKKDYMYFIHIIFYIEP